MTETPAPLSQSREEQRVTEALHRVADFMSRITDLDELLTRVMAESERMLDSEASACMLYDEATDDLYFKVALGEKGEAVKQIRVQRGAGFAGLCLDEQRSLMSNDVANDPRHLGKADEKTQFVTRNLIATPIMHQGRPLGVLEVLNKREGRDYTDEDVRLLEILADQAGVAIANAQLVQRSIQSERLAAIGVAVSGVAHHLKNIVNTVKAPLGVVRMGLQANKPEMVNTSLDVIERASTRMEQSVREMLDFSKDREPDLELDSLNALAAEIVEESRERGRDAGVEVSAELDDRIEPTWLDRLRLHDAILNLVGNAVEAHPRDAEGPWVKVRTRLSREGNIQTIEVEDNGPGIPEDVQARIFQPFFSTKGSKGTGLGLAVTQKVAEENGGRLTLNSEPGRGSTFAMHLPVLRERPAGATSDMEG